MNATLTRLKELRVIPVIAIDRAEDADRLADTLIKGGLPCAEITFRTPAAADAMNIMAKRGDILVGAGTVLTMDQVDTALDAGARFMVSPGSFCMSNSCSLLFPVENILYLYFLVLTILPFRVLSGL